MWQRPCDEGLPVAAVQLDDPAEMQGVNTRADLAQAGRVLNGWCSPS